MGVKPGLRRAATLLVILTVGLVAASVLAPGRIELALRLYALLLAALAVVLLLAALRRAYPPAAPLRRPGPRSSGDGPEPPLTLVRLEREVMLGVASAFDLHYRLRPRLRAIALPLLATRHGISPDDDPERAGRVLGEPAWELLRADRTPPERHGRGLEIRELRSVVEALERI
jgi:hypothetical protein